MRVDSLHDAVQPAGEDPPGEMVSTSSALKPTRRLAE